MISCVKKGLLIKEIKYSLQRLLPTLPPPDIPITFKSGFNSFIFTTNSQSPTSVRAQVCVSVALSRVHDVRGCQVICVNGHSRS